MTVNAIRGLCGERSVGECSYLPETMRDELGNGRTWFVTCSVSDVGRSDGDSEEKVRQ